MLINEVPPNLEIILEFGTRGCYSLPEEDTSGMIDDTLRCSLQYCDENGVDMFHPSIGFLFECHKGNKNNLDAVQRASFEPQYHPAFEGVNLYELHEPLNNNMSKRQLPDHTSDRNSSGLIKTLESLGRTRGSSSTPGPSGTSVESSIPNRGFQKQVTNMSSSTSYVGQGNPTREMTTRGGPSNENQASGAHIRNQSSSTQSGSSNRDQGALLGTHNRNRSSNTQYSGYTQETVHNNTLISPPNFQHRQNQGSNQSSSSTNVSVSSLSAQFQKKLIELQQLISRTSGIPKSLQDMLSQELRRIGQEFNEQQRLLQQDFDMTRKQRDDLERQLRDVTQDRDWMRDQHDRFEETMNDLKLRHKKSKERVGELEARWKRINEGLLDQIHMQEEQLKGRRALWMEANPELSTRRNAMTAIRDPFDSPSTSHTPSFTGGNMGSMVSPSVAKPSQNAFTASNYGPPPQMKLKNTGGLNVGASNYQPSQRRPNMSNTLPTGKALPAPEPHAPWDMSNSSRVFNTEPGDTPSNTMAMVLHQKAENLAPAYTAAISKLYGLIEGWVKDYSSVPNPKNDRLIASSNDILWAYMMNCTYPGHRQDSHTHVVALLNEHNTRYWFVMRMATQYCVKDIMSLDAFKSYNSRVEGMITEAEKKLQERGLNNEARQKYIDQQSEAVEIVVTAHDYQKFRADRLNHHTKQLRDILGPMLNDGVERARAGKDLGLIGVTAWELSVKMHTAHLTFQVYFPETAGKFTVATMFAKDKTKADPMQLQIQQTRLKLVITPVITMRDDRGTTIKAKNLHKSNVLIMN